MLTTPPSRWYSRCDVIKLHNSHQDRNDLDARCILDSTIDDVSRAFLWANAVWLRHVAAEGLRVNVVSPGVIATGMQDRMTSPRGSLGLRPEHVAMTRDGVPVEIVVVAPPGSEMQVNVRCGWHESSTYSTSESPQRLARRFASLPLRGSRHLFDAQTGAAGRLIRRPGAARGDRQFSCCGRV